MLDSPLPKLYLEPIKLFDGGLCAIWSPVRPVLLVL